jgi:hypothetical protein
MLNNQGGGMPEDIEDEYIEYLIQQNALRWGKMLPNGERSLEMNSDVLKVVAPELYEFWMADLENTLMELYQHGLVEVDYDEDLNARFKLSDDAFQEFEDKGFYYNDNNGV